MLKLRRFNSSVKSSVTRYQLSGVKMCVKEKNPKFVLFAQMRL